MTAALLDSKNALLVSWRNAHLENKNIANWSADVSPDNPDSSCILRATEIVTSIFLYFCNKLSKRTESGKFYCIPSYWYVCLCLSVLWQKPQGSISQSLLPDVLPRLSLLFPLTWCFSTWAQCWWGKKAEEQIPEWEKTANRKETPMGIAVAYLQGRGWYITGGKISESSRVIEEKGALEDREGDEGSLWCWSERKTKLVLCGQHSGQKLCPYIVQSATLTCQTPGCSSVMHVQPWLQNISSLTR